MTTSRDENQNRGIYTPFLRRKLRALGCPFECAADWETVRDIVVWLEEEKIRLYPRRRRVPLRTVDTAKEWWSMMKQTWHYRAGAGAGNAYAEAALQWSQRRLKQKYCLDIEMPLCDVSSDSGGCAKPQQLAALLETLTSVAIGDVYQDAVEARALTLHVQKEDQTGIRPSAASPVPSSEVTQEELQTALRPLLALLQLPSLQEYQAADHETISACQAVAARLRACSPVYAKMKRPVPPSDEELQHAANRVLVAMPFAGRGVTHFLTRYLSGLRALHIAVMRDTHERLDVIVEALQTLIGNPVTDSKLGKVGI